jgi:hypothetical protein
MFKKGYHFFVQYCIEIIRAGEASGNNMGHHMMPLICICPWAGGGSSHMLYYLTHPDRDHFLLCSLPMLFCLAPASDAGVGVPVTTF